MGGLFITGEGIMLHGSFACYAALTVQSNIRWAAIKPRSTVNQ
jgi:hypothetical protein